MEWILCRVVVSSSLPTHNIVPHHSTTKKNEDSSSRPKEWKPGQHAQDPDPTQLASTTVREGEPGASHPQTTPGHPWTTAFSQPSARRRPPAIRKRPRAVRRRPQDIRRRPQDIRRRPQAIRRRPQAIRRRLPYQWRSTRDADYWRSSEDGCHDKHE